MKKAILDLTNCRHHYELHQRIQKALDFPDYYGKNLDAFWDCINRDCDIDFVTIVGSGSVSDDLQLTVKKILELLQANKEEWADSEIPFDYEIVS